MQMQKQIFLILIVIFLLIFVSVTAMAAISDTGFSDVPVGAWYAEAAVHCRDNGLIGGTTSTTFSPNVVTTRAMLATILYRQAGSPGITQEADFADTVKNAWYSNAISWAVKSEIVTGYGNGYFGTGDPVTREQIAAILWRDAGRPDIKESPGDFTDENMISSFAVKAVDWAQENGVVTGKANNLFDPKGKVTRAETAAMLYRYLNMKTGNTSEMPDGSATVPNETDNSMMNLSIAVGDRTFSARLHDNEPARAIAQRMPFTLKMNDYASQEKVTDLAFALPSGSATTPAMINAGDIYLWSGNNLVLFYTTFPNSYSYVPIGRITDITGLTDALGSGSVEVTFALVE